MHPSSSPAKLAVECASPCPFAAGVSAAVAVVSDVMKSASIVHCTISRGAGACLPFLHRLGQIQVPVMQKCIYLCGTYTQNPSVKSDSYLSSDLHHPPGGDLEIVGGVVGRAAHANEQVILP